MKKCEKEKNIKELENLEVQCDTFLETLQTMDIWGLNLECLGESHITADTPEWMIFQDDLLELLSKYKKDLYNSKNRIFILYKSFSLFNKAQQNEYKQHNSSLVIFSPLNSNLSSQKKYHS